MSVSSRVDGWLGARIVKPLVFVACLLPACGMTYEFWTDALGPNPTEELLHQTGLTALTILCIALVITPLRRLFGLNRLQRLRRMIGVWSFVYAFAHVTIYVLLDQACLYWSDCHFSFILQDVARRPFIMVGAVAFVSLLILAVTSTNGWIRRLGRKWQTVHRLVYLAAIAAVIHFYWKEKSDTTVPVRYAVAVASLLGFRVIWAVRRRLRTASA